MTPEQFIKFWKEHPAIHLVLFAKEAKVGAQTIREILDGTSKNPQKATMEKLENTAKHYGLTK